MKVAVVERRASTRLLERAVGGGGVAQVKLVGASLKAKLTVGRRRRH